MIEWWNSGYTFLTILTLFSMFLAIGKRVYEENPEFFESGQKYRKDWRTWKPKKDRSIHSKITNSHEE